MQLLGLLYYSSRCEHETDRIPDLPALKKLAVSASKLSRVLGPTLASAIATISEIVNAPTDV